MASCQQYESQNCGDCACQQRPQPLPLPQGQIVCVTCKAYDNLALGIDNGNVKLVISNPIDPTQTWLKIEDTTAKSPVPVFLLWNNFKVIARHVPVFPGQEVTLVPFKGVVQPCMRWSHIGIKDALEFTPIFTPDDNVLEILNLDVDESTLKLVVQKPQVKQSQHWKISTVIPV